NRVAWLVIPAAAPVFTKCSKRTNGSRKSRYSRIRRKCMEKMTEPVHSEDILAILDRVLAERRKAAPENSYTAALYAGGGEHICAKIDEEAAEVIEAANETDDAHLIHEVADLWFHCMVLLQLRGLDAQHVQQELARRFGVSGHEEKASRTDS